MFGPADKPLERTPDSRMGGTPVRTGPPITPIAIGGALILAFIVGGAWWMSRQPATAHLAAMKAKSAAKAKCLQRKVFLGSFLFSFRS